MPEDVLTGVVVKRVKSATKRGLGRVVIGNSLHPEFGRAEDTVFQSLLVQLGSD